MLESLEKLSLKNLIYSKEDKTVIEEEDMESDKEKEEKF